MDAQDTEGLTDNPSWKALGRLAEHYAGTELTEIVARDTGRFERYSIEVPGLFLDYSRNLITDQVRTLLVRLAEERGVPWWRHRLFSGEKLNHTEQRAAAHMALRVPEGETFEVDGADVAAEVHAELRRMADFVGSLVEGRWRGADDRSITDVVNIGIGGSHLGPQLACEALPRAHDIRVHFLSSLDPVQTRDLLDGLEPGRTLFIVASKSFGTEETLANAELARAWIQEALGEEAARDHFVAVSAKPEKAVAFGIAADHVFSFHDWVGGRYSLWSAIGLPVMIHAGEAGFRELLAGAHAMDQHFQQAPLEANMPVMLAMLGIWYRNFLDCQSHAVLPYMHRLRRLPDYLQQLEMESLGKGVDRDGREVDYATGGILWGGMGNEAQHAFFQLLHQGTVMVPLDLLVLAETETEARDSQHALQANALAQGAALMLGKDEDQVIEELVEAGMSRERMAELLAYKLFKGGRPSNTLVLDRLDAQTLGELIALYEHKVFVQSVIWHINPFDQWGVELGKQLAGPLKEQLAAGEPAEGQDVSTEGLLRHILERRGKD